MVLKKSGRSWGLDCLISVLVLAVYKNQNWKLSSTFNVINAKKKIVLTSMKDAPSKKASVLNENWKVHILIFEIKYIDFFH